MKKMNKVILLPRKLHKTQTEIMTREAQSFTRNNHTKSCRLPVPCIHKLGWQETHMFQKTLSKNSATTIIVIGDAIATGLIRYQHTWRIDCQKKKKIPSFSTNPFISG